MSTTSPARVTRRAPRLRLRALSSRSLFWRIVLVNASLVTVAVILLAVTPLTVSNPVKVRQLLYLGAGLVVVVTSNILLLRVSLRPLRELVDAMERIDLLRPGRRLAAGGVHELNVVTSAFNTMLERLEGERRVSSRRSVGREESERRRIANELHDQVGQGLTALLLQLKTAIQESSPSARPALFEAQTIARDNLDEVRRIARRLRPTVLDDLGLPYALAALAEAAESQSPVAISRDIELDVEVPLIPEPLELALYRIAQEALSNSIRHANAAWIELSFVPLPDGRVRLAVSDDGRGMLYAVDVEGGGIRGMRERAVAVGADLRIESRPGGGTTVIVVASPS
jgi:two-component system sensor histidine kinase UhpB